MFSSPAAAVKLCRRAAASKARIAVSGGRLCRLVLTTRDSKLKLDGLNAPDSRRTCGVHQTALGSEAKFRVFG